MERKKLNTIVTVVIIILIAVVGSVIFLFNYSQDESSLTVLEKKWINDNINKVVDINIYNDIPVYSYNGNGIIFDYLDYFSEEYGVKFNKISSYEEKDLIDKELVFLSLNNDAKLDKNDILIYEDHYVVLKSNTNDYINKENIDTLGVLKIDENIIKKYFNNDNIVYTSYENVTDLINAYKNTEVNYLILPNVRYMDDILKNNDEDNVIIVFEVFENVENLIEYIKEFDKRKVVVYDGYNIVQVNIEDIMYFYSDGNYNFCKTKDKQYRVKRKLYEIDKISNDFVRISKGCIINIKQVKSFDIGENRNIIVKFIDNSEQYVARRKIKEVMNYLDERMI
mgnify:CR=1 FL=1